MHKVRITRVTRREQAYLDVIILLPTQLDFAKLALANGVAKNEFSKLGRAFVLTIAVVVTAAGASALLLGSRRRWGFGVRHAAAVFTAWAARAFDFPGSRR